MFMIVVFAARTICSSTRRRYLFRGLLHNAPRQEGADHCFRAMQVTDFQEGRAGHSRRGCCLRGLQVDREIGAGRQFEGQLGGAGAF
jgi:hypothetical protein